MTNEGGGLPPAVTCAVVVPVYRPLLLEDERTSLRHLEHFLPRADKILVMPHGLEFSRPGYVTARFAPRFFAGIAGYNDLMLSREFYARFEAYDFILVYQLDAILLDSGLDRFLGMGVDYVGAPWVTHDERGNPRLRAVGNGGLSLRRVRAFLDVLDSRVRPVTAREHFLEHYAGKPLGEALVGLGKSAVKGLGFRNSVRSTIELARFGNEDAFFSLEATRFLASFKVASLPQGLEFAFEREPRFCLEMAGGRLPMGAHAWARYDRGFWEPHLLTQERLGERPGH